MSIHNVLLRNGLWRPAGSPGSQVVKEHGNRGGKERDQADQSCQQRPVKPGRRRLLFVEALEHGRPKVAARFGLCFDGRQGLVQQLPDAVFFQVILIVFIHGLIPCCSRSFLNNRSARNTRSFTAATEIPSASATSLCGCCSTTASTAAMRSLGGSRWNASTVFKRISAETAGSPITGAGKSIGSSAVSSCSDRILRIQSRAA